MPKYADLEIGLHCRAAGTWSAELRFNDPESATDLIHEEGSLHFDFEALRGRRLDPTEYGNVLGGSLFVGEVKEEFERIRGMAERDQLSLRIRLRIGPSAPELHELWWETLLDPRDGTALLTDERLVFSRYLASPDWRPVGMHSKSELRTLVVIANPSNLQEYEPGGRVLPPIDVEHETKRAESALTRTPTILASGGAATLGRMREELRKGYGILYLMCHGYIDEGESQILLEDPTGRVARVPGRELVDVLRDLWQRPRLVVLASCQSAGPGGEDDGGALKALGPRMAEAGIPAVLAMQGKVSVQTVAEFMPVFFSELDRDGQVDLAVTRARAAVRGRDDWWAPVLFTRLKSGRFWYTPGFSGGHDFERWPGLLDHIRRGRCTPVLGPGLMDEYIGSRQQLAQRWASTYRFPMARHLREDLPHVAQYLAVNQGYEFSRNELRDYVRRELLERYGRHLGPGPDPHSLSPDELITAAGAYRRGLADSLEPHAVLARLPFKMFLTTPPADLLADALTAEGKAPQVELCRWKAELDWPPSVFDDPDSPYEPSAHRPLVYHLFGSLKYPDTVVLTEDDYFDYLIGVTRDRELIPETVRRALTDSALLFLGFHLDQWDFAVLFRSILGQQASRWKRYTHVAAQIDPEEGHAIDPGRARRYLESYFSELDQIKVSIYWGSVQDFVRELSKHWPQEAR